MPSVHYGREVKIAFAYDLLTRINGPHPIPKAVTARAYGLSRELGW